MSAEREGELADPPKIRLPDLEGAVSGIDTFEVRLADLIPEVVVPNVGPTSAVLDVVRAAIGTSVIQLMRHDAGVRSGHEPEDVHQARVATRRLRSDLLSFREILEPAWAVDLRVELGWLGGRLGAVRDADVLMERLRAAANELPDRDAVVAERILDRLWARRDEDRTSLLDAMRSTRYLELLSRLVAASAQPVLRPEAGAGDPTSVVARVMRRPWARLRRAVDALGPDASDAELHQARIRAKRVRYAAEAVAPVFGKRARAFAHAAAELQRVLGDHQDSVVAAAWLREVSTSGARAAFVAGELAAAEHAAAAAARVAWPAAWKALARKRLRFWT
jgi:CHAD domain-containing protein